MSFFTLGVSPKNKREKHQRRKFPTKSIEMVGFKVNLLIYNYLPLLNAKVGIQK